jgi:hypothetical protein
MIRLQFMFLLLAIATLVSGQSSSPVPSGGKAPAQKFNATDAERIFTSRCWLLPTTAEFPDSLRWPSRRSQISTGSFSQIQVTVTKRQMCSKTLGCLFADSC